MRTKKSKKLVVPFLLLLFLLLAVLVYFFYSTSAKEKSALLVVDWTKEFRDEPGSDLYIGMGRISQNINSIRDFSKQNNMIIFYSVDQRMAKNKSDLAGSILLKIEPSELGNIYPKEEFDASSSKALVERLRAENIKDIYLIGVATNFCILETAKGFDEKGFNVFVIKEGIAGHSNDDTKESLKALSLYSKLVSKTAYYTKFFGSFTLFS